MTCSLAVTILRGTTRCGTPASLTSECSRHIVAARSHCCHKSSPPHIRPTLPSPRPQQAQKLKQHLASRPSGGRSFTAFDLVVVSPLTRTCETAFHIFGPGRQPGKPSFLSTLDAPDGSEEKLRGEKVPAPRILVREECRERWGQYVCDGRRPVSEVMPEFPLFDWSEVPYDDDHFYTEDARESDEHCCERGIAFLQWLNKRPEKCIAVVTHSSFLRHIFTQFGGNLHKDDQDSLQRLAGNCELRSIVMCSHGNKDGLDVPPLTSDVPRSTVRISSATDLLAGAHNAPP